MGERNDVIVVGAGLAGLTAALRLNDAGIDVTVLEAGHRVGGRTESGWTADGQWIELGGQWVGPDHTELRRLIDRCGLSTVAFGTAGRTVAITAGRRRVVDPSATTDAGLGDADRRDIAAAIELFAQIVDAVELTAPWRTPDAERLDEVTFAGWIDTHLRTDDARRWFRTACELVFAPHPHEVSLLHAAVYFKSGSHLAGLRDTDRDTQEERVLGGASAISDRIAELLGARVRLGTPVRTIVHDDDGVTVITRDGARHTAGRVIVTLPPALAGRLEYEPALPSARDQLTQRLHSISVVKMYLRYATPFWRDDGLSGHAVIDSGPLKLVLDNTPPGYGGGLLVTFLEGADKLGLALTTPRRRRDAFLAVATAAFGPAAAAAVEYLERDWTAQEFFRGCYGGHFAPGTWSAYGPALTAPVGPIHWAGTETSPTWTGYMEGAVRSGLRVADEVMGSPSGAPTGQESW